MPSYFYQSLEGFIMKKNIKIKITSFLIATSSFSPLFAAEVVNEEPVEVSAQQNDTRIDLGNGNFIKLGTYDLDKALRDMPVQGEDKSGRTALMPQTIKTAKSVTRKVLNGSTQQSDFTSEELSKFSITVAAHLRRQLGKNLGPKAGDLQMLNENRMLNISYDDEKKVLKGHSRPAVTLSVEDMMNAFTVLNFSAQ